MKSVLEYYAETLGNKILRDENGIPGVFVRHPKQKSIEFDALLPDHTHPAFVVGNTEDPALLIGKYKNSEINGRLYSLPMALPKNSDYDRALERQRTGENVSGLTIADHGLLVLTAHKAGKVSHGNTNHGADYRAGTVWETEKTVSAGDKRIFRGWEYTCLIGHTTSIQYMPANAPAYWAKGRYVGGAVEESGIYTLTGSGPIDWNFLEDPCLEADIAGNVSEQVYGFRLVNCEIQILPNNNASDPNANLSEMSSLWKAIKPHAEDDGYDLVAPGTEGTVHYNFVGDKIVLDTAVSDLTIGDKCTAFKSVGVNTENLPHVPHILYELGLAPIPGTTVDGDLYVSFAEGERVARRGGNYGTAAHSGIAALNCTHDRRTVTMYYGSRARARITE